MSKTAIFIHVASLPRWIEILNNFLEKITSSGLIEYVNHIFINIVGSMTKNSIDLVVNKNKCIFTYDGDLSDFEVPTLSKLYEFAKNNPDFKLLYLHTKGVGKDINLCIEDWVAYEIYFLVTKYAICLDKLESSSSVGIDLRSTPTLHYSGNFWWARADHILTLPHPVEFKNIKKYPNPLNSARHNQEFWICFKSDLHQSIWDCGISVYERHLHRYLAEKYVDIKS